VERLRFDERIKNLQEGKNRRTHARVLGACIFLRVFVVACFAHLVPVWGALAPLRRWRHAAVLANHHPAVGARRGRRLAAPLGQIGRQVAAAAPARAAEASLELEGGGGLGVPRGARRGRRRGGGW